MTQRISLTILILLSLPTWGLQAQSSRSIYSWDAEQLFAMARDLWAPVELQSMGYTSTDIDLEQAQTRLRQGCLYLEAAVGLDPSYAPAWHDLTALYTTDVINDPNRVESSFFKYNSLKPEDDLQVSAWLSYSLENLNDRESREEFLGTYLSSLSAYPVIYSQVLTQMGIYAWEKGIIEDPPLQPDETQQYGARSYFRYALNDFKDQPLLLYFDQALVQLSKLPIASAPDPTAQLSPDSYEPVLWRVRMRNNPYDLIAAFNLIKSLELRGKHDLAQEYYAHADYLINSVPEAMTTISDPQALQKELHYMRLLGAYFFKDYSTSINLAQGLLSEDPDNFQLKVLLAKSMEQMGTHRGAEDIMKRLAGEAIQKFDNADPQDYQLQSESGRFFSFIVPDPNLALQYALRAYQGQPDRLSTNILAYAYLLNEQPQQAQAILGNPDPNDTLSSLTAAAIALAGNKKDSALQYLQQTETAYASLKRADIFQAAILNDHIEQLHRTLQPELTTPAPLEQDQITETFVAKFNGNDLLFAVTPEKAIRCTMNFSTDIFQYGDPMIVRLFLSNISGINNMETNLVLGPDNMIDPHVIITAEIESIPGSPGPSETARSADAETMILSYRYLLQRTVLRPGQSNTVSESLNIAKLRQILQDHPQQTYNITFRAYLDPVPDGNGGFRSRIPSLQPAPVTVTRRGFTPTLDRMDAVYHAARAGTPRERTNAIGLAAGLLHEADLARRGRFSYRPQAIEPDTLRQIITENLAHPNPCISGWSVYALRFSTITAESSEAKQLAEFLSDSDWFVRFMVVQTLNPITDLTEYFRWAALVEQNPLLRRQLLLLQHLPWRNF